MPKKFFFYWGPVFIWCGVIFGFSSIPTLPRVGFIWWDFLLKKTAHIIEYGTLYILVLRAIARINFQFSIFNDQSIFNFQIIKKKIKKIYWILPLIFGILYAMSDEYHQSFIIGRTSRIRDVGFDGLGMLLSWWWIRKKLKMKN